jgi:hypothetical protein
VALRQSQPKYTFVRLEKKRLDFHLRIVYIDTNIKWGEVKTIYCAGPYTKGDLGVNIRRVIDVSDELARAGFAVFCPLLTHFWHIVHPHPYEFWMKQDLAWLRRCDAMVYVKGESKGVETEKVEARMIGLPIFEWAGKTTIGQLTNLDLFKNEEKLI